MDISIIEWQIFSFELDSIHIDNGSSYATVLRHSTLLTYFGSVQSVSHASLLCLWKPDGFLRTKSQIGFERMTREMCSIYMCPLRAFPQYCTLVVPPARWTSARSSNCLAVFIFCFQEWEYGSTAFIRSYMAHVCGERSITMLEAWSIPHPPRGIHAAQSRIIGRFDGWKWEIS